MQHNKKENNHFWLKRQRRNNSASEQMNNGICCLAWLVLAAADDDGKLASCSYVHSLFNLVTLHIQANLCVCYSSQLPTFHEPSHLFLSFRASSQAIR